MKITTVRGILLLAGVALIVLKLAGVIDWPWLAVAVPIVAWAYPWIAGAAAILVHLLMGVVVIAVVMVMGVFAERELRREALRLQAQRQREIEEGHAVAGIWDN